MNKSRFYIFLAVVLALMIWVYKSADTEVDDTALLPPVIDETKPTVTDTPVELEKYPEVFNPTSKESPQTPIVSDEEEERSKVLLSPSTRKIKAFIAQEAVRKYGAVTGLNITPPIEFIDFELSDFEANTVILETVANQKKQILLLAKSSQATGEELVKRLAAARNLDLNQAADSGSNSAGRFYHLVVQDRSIVFMTSSAVRGGYLAAWTQPTAHSREQIESFKKSVSVGVPTD